MENESLNRGEDAPLRHQTQHTMSFDPHTLAEENIRRHREFSGSRKVAAERGQERGDAKDNSDSPDNKGATPNATNEQLQREEKPQSAKEETTQGRHKGDSRHEEDNENQHRPHTGG